MTIEEVYFPEEIDVWLIPAMGTYGDGPSFDAYIHSIKPRILEEELGNYGILSADDIPGPWTADLFDEFFDLEIHDRARKAPI